MSPARSGSAITSVTVEKDDSRNPWLAGAGKHSGSRRRRLKLAGWAYRSQLPVTAKVTSSKPKPPNWVRWSTARSHQRASLNGRKTTRSSRPRRRHRPADLDRASKPPTVLAPTAPGPANNFLLDAPTHDQGDVSQRRRYVYTAWLPSRVQGEPIPTAPSSERRHTAAHYECVQVRHQSDPRPMCGNFCATNKGDAHV